MSRTKLHFELFFNDINSNVEKISLEIFLSEAKENFFCAINFLTFAHTRQLQFFFRELLSNHVKVLCMHFQRRATF